MENGSKENKGCTLTLAIIFIVGNFVTFAKDSNNVASLGWLVVLAGGIVGGYFAYVGIKSHSSSKWVMIGAILIGLSIFVGASMLSDDFSVIWLIGLLVGLLICIILGVYISGNARVTIRQGI